MTVSDSYLLDKHVTPPSQTSVSINHSGFSQKQNSWKFIYIISCDTEVTFDMESLENRCLKDLLSVGNRLIEIIEYYCRDGEWLKPLYLTGGTEETRLMDINPQIDGKEQDGNFADGTIWAGTYL